MRYFPDTGIRWELMRSPSTNNLISLKRYEIAAAITNEDYKSEIFDLYFSISEFLTNSLWDFLTHIIDTNQDIAYSKITNDRNSKLKNVPIIRHAQLEDIGIGILEESGYKSGKAILNDIYHIYHRSHGLKIKREVEKPEGLRYKNALGRILFDIPEIHIFCIEDKNYNKERFVVAHEIAHLALNHSKYMHREICQESDFIQKQVNREVSDISRMEYRANYLAGCLLMPKEPFLYSFWQRMILHRLID